MSAACEYSWAALVCNSAWDKCPDRPDPSLSCTVQSWSGVHLKVGGAARGDGQAEQAGQLLLPPFEGLLYLKCALAVGHHKAQLQRVCVGLHHRQLAHQRVALGPALTGRCLPAWMSICSSSGARFHQSCDLSIAQRTIFGLSYLCS